MNSNLERFNHQQVYFLLTTLFNMPQDVNHMSTGKKGAIYNMFHEKLVNWIIEN